MIDSDRPKDSLEQTINRLISSSRMLGATQAKKAYNAYTQSDGRFEQTCQQNIEEVKQFLLNDIKFKVVNE